MIVDVPLWFETAIRAAGERGNALQLSAPQVAELLWAMDRPRTAAEKLGARPASIPGLWNVPGHPELTTAQLIDLAARQG